jgi:hypothetical protein
MRGRSHFVFGWLAVAGVLLARLRGAMHGPGTTSAKTPSFRFSICWPFVQFQPSAAVDASLLRPLVTILCTAEQALSYGGSPHL